MIYSYFVNSACVEDRELLNNNRYKFLHKYNLIIIYEYDNLLNSVEEKVMN